MGQCRAVAECIHGARNSELVITIWVSADDDVAPAAASAVGAFLGAFLRPRNSFHRMLGARGTRPWRLSVRSSSRSVSGRPPASRRRGRAGPPERQEAALGDQLVGGHHRVAADGELEVGVPRRPRRRLLLRRRRRLEREVAGEGYPRRHERRRLVVVMLRVVHVNTCHASTPAGTRALSMPRPSQR